MIIESVELDNFKSFGNKRKILFKNGFTIITGPNGSGKSNIGDAMLFVLGIRSSKAIRADRLPDLIHKGGPGSRVRNSCSVTIVMDSEDSTLQEGERKTRITREISVDEHQECKSTYFINGVRAKRSDVETILDNAQIYLDAYSFVLQGDINNLVKMTGTERRRLLESIAGIESYNIQIEKARSDIDGIEGNLSKIQILIDETRRRSEQLAEEKKNAERYNELSNEIGSLESTLLHIDLIGADRELNAYLKTLDELNSQIQLSRTRIEELSTKIKDLEEESISVEKEKNRFGGDELKKITQKISDLTLEKAKEEINIENLRDDISDLEASIADLSENNATLLEQIKASRAEKSTAEKSLEDADRKIGDLSKRLATLRSNTENTSRQFTTYRKQLEEIEAHITETNSESISITEEESNLKSAREKILSDLRHMESRESDLLLELNDAKYKLEAIDKDSSTNRKAYEDLNDKYLALRKKVSDGDRRKDELNRALIETTKEYEKLSASMSRSTQSSRTFSAILEARASGEITGVHGLVKDLICYDSKFQTAISAAGGGRLNAVVVEDDGVAESCLNLLKRKKAGKLTFLPINKILNGRPRAKAIMVRNSNETLGYIFENINFDKKYENIIWYAFQDCLIVPDVATARKHMTGVRLVTLDGDIFESSGAITGGFSEKREETSERRYADLSEKMSTLSVELEALKAQLSLDRNELDSVTTMLSSSSKNMGSGNSQNTIFIEIRDRASRDLEKIRVDLSTIRKQHEKSEQDLQDALGRRNTISEKLDDLDKKKKQIMAKMAEVSPELIEEQTTLEADIAALRTEKEALSTRVFTVSSDLRIQEKTHKDQEAQISREQKEVDSKKVGITNIQSTLSNTISELEKSRLVEEQLNSRAKEYNDRINALNIEIQSFRGNIETADAMIRSYEDNKLNTSLRIQAINEKITQLNQQIAESRYPPLETSQSPTEIKRRISSLKRDVESLGAVNQLAIKEYDDEIARLFDLNEKISKLIEEKSGLEEMMEDLNNKKRTVFLELYYKINESMQEIYSTLSEGGEARLDLSDMNDPLNSDLFIRARPKGSTFSKIESLSGGEKSLTAISFILAVQRIKPSPVYYLDEIDMFLDGANAERIGKMFSENAKYSQVLMVSLKKAMLKYANNLIGVTTLDEENSEIYSKDFEAGGVNQ